MSTPKQNFQTCIGSSNATQTGQFDQFEWHQSGIEWLRPNLRKVYFRTVHSFTQHTCMAEGDKLTAQHLKELQVLHLNQHTRNMLTSL